MKKTLIFSAVVAAMLVGCNDTKETAKSVTHKAAETTTHAVEATKEATKEVVKSTTEAAKATTEAVKETASKAVEKTAEAAKETAKKAVEATKETVTATVEKAKEKVVAAVAPKADGKALFVTCAGCHGAKAEKKALGASKVIGGWDVAKTEEALKGYKAGTYGGAMKGVMAGQAAKLDDAKIKALAEYISTLK